MVNAKAVLGLVGKGFAVVLAAMLVTSLVAGGLVAGGVVEVGTPTVEDVRTEWGSVTSDETEIEATVEIDNPNPVGVPNMIDVGYDIKMNDVTVGEGEEKGVGLESGSTDLEFEAGIESDEVTEWWVSHIDNGEETDVSVTADVQAPLVSRTFDVKQETIETDFLGGLEGNGGQTFAIDGRQVAVTQETTVQWGDADEETTPVTVSVTVENTASEAITVRDLSYDVRFNDVVLGNGQDTQSYTIQPGQTRTVEFTLELDTQKVEEWWPTHVEAADGTEVEQTRVVTRGSVIVESNGRADRVNLDAMSSTTVFNTEFIAEDDDDES